MSSVIQTTFVLSGPLAGKTINLGSWPYPFVEGRLTIHGPAEEIAMHARFLERNWQAYPEGHPNLKENGDGQRDIQAAAQQHGEPTADGNVQLQKAVLALDPADDTHWTKDGKPAMTAVEKLYGSSGITRADVEAAAPGHSREKAKAAAQ